MTQGSAPTTGAIDAARPPMPAGPAPAPARPVTAPRPTAWTAGRITALVIGGLLALTSLGLLGAGSTALWWSGTQRDAAGYVSTGVHQFSSAGSALATERIDLGSPGVGWLYSSVLLGRVRIQVTPASSDSAVFVGIAPSGDVDRYLAGVRHTVISDYWSGRQQSVGGGTVASPPGAQDFWVASDSGPGVRTLLWNPANGAWTVVVMNANGRPGVGVGAELGARLPALTWIGVVSLVLGVLLAIGGALLITGAIRRARRAGRV